VKAAELNGKVNIICDALKKSLEKVNKENKYLENI
jgi:hypothetical protein